MKVLKLYSIFHNLLLRNFSGGTLVHYWLKFLS